jgi:hypothetical protein
LKQNKNCTQHELEKSGRFELGIKINYNFEIMNFGKDDIEMPPSSSSLPLAEIVE